MAKVKRYTRKQLHRERARAEREAAAAAKEQRLIEKDNDRTGRFIDAVLKQMGHS